MGYHFLEKIWVLLSSARELGLVEGKYFKSTSPIKGMAYCLQHQVIVCWRRRCLFETLVTHQKKDMGWVNVSSGKHTGLRAATSGETRRDDGQFVKPLESRPLSYLSSQGQLTVNNFLFGLALTNQSCPPPTLHEWCVMWERLLDLVNAVNGSCRLLRKFFYGKWVNVLLYFL